MSQYFFLGDSKGVWNLSEVSQHLFSNMIRRVSWHPSIRCRVSIDSLTPRMTLKMLHLWVSDSQAKDVRFSYVANFWEKLLFGHRNKGSTWPRKRCDFFTNFKTPKMGVIFSISVGTRILSIYDILQYTYCRKELMNMVKGTFNRQYCTLFPNRALFWRRQKASLYTPPPPVSCYGTN